MNKQPYCLKFTQTSPCFFINDARCDRTFRHGIRETIRSPEQALDLYKKLSPSDQDYYQATQNTVILGTATECRAEIEQLAESFDVDEMMLVNVIYDFADRCASYSKLMAEFSK